MARGVSQNFLAVTRREERLGRRTAVTAAALALPTAFFADLADGPAYGPVWAMFLAATLLGVVLGVVLARRRLARWEGDLRLRWNHWMRFSARAERLADIERAVHERDPLPAGLASAGAVGLLAFNLAVFALLWVGHPAGEPLAWLVVACDGLVLGGLVATSALVARWARDFAQSAERLVQEGELAMWGER